MTSGEYRVPQNGIQIRDLVRTPGRSHLFHIEKHFAFSTAHTMTPTKSSDALLGSWRPVPRRKWN